MKRIFLAVAFGFGALLLGTASCGDDTGGAPDGDQDATVVGDADAGPSSDGGPGSDGSTNDAGCFFCDAGQCQPLGHACTAPSECCSQECVNGSCQAPPCTADNASCSTNAQCCSGACNNGTCTPLNTNCKTLGNPCTANSDCCSLFCQNGYCAAPSYCGQLGDICSTGADCCGGICNKAPNMTFGICGQPPQQGAQCSQIDGVVCSPITADGGVTYIDGGIPLCGGACCSRSCAPWGPTQVLICQPASGCHPVGDICYKDNDCCGGQGTNPTEVCNFSGDAGVGVCSNPTGCKPNGDICRLQTNQCNATDNCCSGNVQQYDTCKQDNLGVPRCSYAGDAGCIPVDAGTQCASSADCCNLNPCVPDGDGGFTCYPQTCVPVNGPCTNDGDCCPGGHCYIQGGQTSGSCQPNSDGGTSDGGGADGGDGGPPCAYYGQTCTTSSDCCNNIPCTNGRCVIPVN
jgi:hypothetical protein